MGPNHTSWPMALGRIESPILNANAAEPALAPTRTESEEPIQLACLEPVSGTVCVAEATLTIAQALGLSALAGGGLYLATNPNAAKNTAASLHGTINDWSRVVNDILQHVSIVKPDQNPLITPIDSSAARPSAMVERA